MNPIINLVILYIIYININQLTCLGVIPTINPIISLAINQRSPIVWGPLPVPDINEAMIACSATAQSCKGASFLAG